MGWVADWVQVIKAAQYLNTTPWDLMERPAAWMAWANELMRADSEIRAAQRKANG